MTRTARQRPSAMVWITWAPVRCPHCEAITGGRDGGVEPPRQGSWSVCGHCGYVAVFTVKAGRLAVREPTADERVAIAGDAALQAVLVALAGAGGDPARAVAILMGLEGSSYVD